MIKAIILAAIAATNVPFMAEHRVVSPSTVVSTNLYGSVTGIVDRAYIESHGGGGGGGSGTSTNAVNYLINRYDVTNLTGRINAKQDALPYSTNAIPATAIANAPWVSRDALWTNEVNQLWRDLALEVKTYLHDETSDRYYKLYADATGGDVTAAIDTNGVDYEDIAYPYWFRYANEYLGDVNAFVVSVPDNHTYTIRVNGNGSRIDWGDGNTTEVKDNLQFYSNTYARAGYYTISFKDTGLIWRTQGNNITEVYEPVAITKFQSSNKYLSYAFTSCTNLHGVIPDYHTPINMNGTFANIKRNVGLFSNDADRTMPAGISSGNYGQCVLNSSFALRKHFFTSWGGSNGWTGEYYTQANAPVPSLVGERIYEPIGNVNSFEIKLAPNDYSNNVFTFEMRVQSFNNRNIRVDWGDGTLTTYPSNDVASVVTIISHNYTKPSGNATNAYVVCVDSGAKSLHVGTVNIENATPEDSQWYVTRALSWSDTIIDTASALRCCHNMIGTIPQWKNQTSISACYYRCNNLEGSFPAFNYSAQYRRMYSLYGRCGKVTGVVPKWPDLSGLSSDGVRSVYYMCAGLTGFWNGTGVDAQSLSERCPAEIGHQQTYQSASDAVRNLVYQSWGGTIPDPQ